MKGAGEGNPSLVERVRGCMGDIENGARHTRARRQKAHIIRGVSAQALNLAKPQASTTPR